MITIVKTYQLRKGATRVMNEIGKKTVCNHISNVIQKLGVKGRSQAVFELVRLGELEICTQSTHPPFSALGRKGGFFMFISSE
ncbi:hypothetical protein ABD77_19760 [Brevibacillus formosus]|nr:hypothetical protein [Brevibacillus formosus]